MKESEQNDSHFIFLEAIFCWNKRKSIYSEEFAFSKVLQIAKINGQSIKVDVNRPSTYNNKNAFELSDDHAKTK